jgi:hypothetical protein
MGRRHGWDCADHALLHHRQRTRATAILQHQAHDCCERLDGLAAFGHVRKLVRFVRAGKLHHRLRMIVSVELVCRLLLSGACLGSVQINLDASRVEYITRQASPRSHRLLDRFENPTKT